MVNWAHQAGKPLIAFKVRPHHLFSDPLHTAIFWTLFSLWVVPEIAFWKRKRSADQSKLQDKHSLGLIVILFWFGIAADFAISLLVPEATINNNRQTIFYFGVGLMAAGMILRWYCIHVLGELFTFDVAIDKAHLLVERGPYKYLRHPSYTGALLTLFGFGLALGNWLGLFAALFCMSVAYSYRIPLEEAVLVNALGDPYRQYMKRTWRLGPFLF